MGLGDKRGTVTHGLRGTVGTFLLEAGRADSSDMDKTGNQQAEVLISYLSLAGNKGKLQNRNIFKSGDQGGGSCLPNLKSKQLYAPDVSAETQRPSKQERPDLNYFMSNNCDLEK